MRWDGTGDSIYNYNATRKQAREANHWTPSIEFTAFMIAYGKISLLSRVALRFPAESAEV